MAFVLEKHPTRKVVDSERNATLFLHSSGLWGPDEFELQWKDHKTRFYANYRSFVDKNRGGANISWNVHSMPLAAQLPKAEIRELLDLVEDALRVWSNVDGKNFKVNSFTVNFPDEPIPQHWQQMAARLERRKLFRARLARARVMMVVAPLMFCMIVIVAYFRVRYPQAFDQWTCRNLHMHCPVMNYHPAGLPYAE